MFLVDLVGDHSLGLSSLSRLQQKHLVATESEITSKPVKIFENKVQNVVP